MIFAFGPYSSRGSYTERMIHRILTIKRLRTFSRLQVSSVTVISPGGQYTGRKRPNREVWSRFVLLSLLAVLPRIPATNAAHHVPGQTIREIQRILKDKKGIMEKSDAEVYAPAVQSIPVNCTKVVFYCYLLELSMILHEDKMANPISGPSTDLWHPCPTESVFRNCSPCESETVNTTTFLERMELLLQIMSAS